MLPAPKDEFPKCLYLDQNKLIDLARAHYDRPDGEAFKDALKAVQSAVEAGKLLVPFSVVNAIESMVSRDAGRRDRLARFIVSLSGNLTVLPEEAACRLEVENAAKLTLGMGQVTPVRPRLVQRGFAHALGLGLEVRGPATGLVAALRHIHSPEMTIDFLKSASGQREQIDQGRAGEAGAAGVFERDRETLAGLPLEERRGLELEALFFGRGPYRSDLASALQGLGVTAQDFRSKVSSGADAARFLGAVPNLDTLLTLRLARDRDSVRAIQPNDIRDLDWLSVAVPYANVVVAEKYWGHQVRATGLDKKYGTRLLTDLRELPDLLREMGCIA